MRSTALSLDSSSTVPGLLALERTSAEVSTTTAMTRLRTPKTSVKGAPMKTTAVQGWNSMTGPATCPQWSPAMAVWKSVRLACGTEENDLGHLAQSAHSPWSASSVTYGWISTTAMLAQMLMPKAVSRTDQRSVRVQLPINSKNLVSSRKNLTFRTKRARRMTRKIRRARMAPKPPAFLWPNRSTYSRKPWRMMNTSNQHQGLQTMSHLSA
mmetsp:Transcript_47562/g.142086  ORF Transcript_47562/g.142086 Transcript_47562/m.142086 type:complete len:211 (-) Transcript_47562:732-1364(-)